MFWAIKIEAINHSFEIVYGMNLGSRSDFIPGISKEKGINSLCSIKSTTQTGSPNLDKELYN